MTKMSNSGLVSYKKISPNKNKGRKYEITRITPHCVVGQLDVKTLGNIFAKSSVQASSNYGIGADGRIGMYVEEKDRSWCSSSSDNDNRAVTIECASNAKSPYAFKKIVYNALVDLCVDICRRNNKKKLIWIPDKKKALSYKPAKTEMILTVHRWFAAKECPGDWMYARMDDLAQVVTKRLNVIYRVQVGAFSKKDNAEKLSKKLADKGYETVIVMVDDLYKVQLGAFSIKAYAEKLANKLNREGFKAIITTK